MKHAALFFASAVTFAACLAFVAIAPFTVGCNTAQVTQPAIIDAGPACPLKPPVVSCDAGTFTVGACAGGVTVQLDSADAPDASNTITAGSYALGCTVAFYVPDNSSPDCLRAEPCTCVSPLAGDDAGDDAGADAGGAVPPGVWQCFPTQPQ